MTDDPSRSLQGRVESQSTVPYCTSDLLDVSLHWRAADDGSVRGRITVRNTGLSACRVGGKPVVIPLGVDGTPLPVETLVTMEQRIPSWVVLQPGGRAAAGVGWGGWCGDAASGRARVRWEQGEATLTVDGPAQPRCPEAGQPLTLWSSWFAPVGDGTDGPRGDKPAPCG